MVDKVNTTVVYIGLGKQQISATMMRTIPSISTTEGDSPTELVRDSAHALITLIQITNWIQVTSASCMADQAHAMIVIACVTEA